MPVDPINIRDITLFVCPYCVQVAHTIAPNISNPAISDLYRCACSRYRYWNPRALYMAHSVFKVSIPAAFRDHDNSMQIDHTKHLIRRIYV
jgi:hypothetical protein